MVGLVSNCLKFLYEFGCLVGSCIDELVFIYLCMFFGLKNIFEIFCCEKDGVEMVFFDEMMNLWSDFGVILFYNYYLFYGFERERDKIVSE